MYRAALAPGGTFLYLKIAALVVALFAGLFAIRSWRDTPNMALAAGILAALGAGFVFRSKWVLVAFLLAAYYVYWRADRAHQQRR